MLLLLLLLMLVLVLVDDVAVHVMMHGESNNVLAISKRTICVLPPFSLAHLIFEIPKETTTMVTTGPLQEPQCWRLWVSPGIREGLYLKRI